MLVADHLYFGHDLPMDTRQILSLAAARRHATTGSGEAIRKAARLTLAEIASAIGASEASVCRWEKGQQTPRTAVGIRWAELLAELEKTLPATRA